MTVIIPQQNRNAGTYRTNPKAIDVLPNGQVTLTAIMDAADQADTSLLMTLGMEGNEQAGAAANDPNWFVVVATTWQGGLSAKTGLPLDPPSVSWSSSVVSAQTVRGLAMISKRINVGLDEVVA